MSRTLYRWARARMLAKPILQLLAAIQRSAFEPRSCAVTLIDPAQAVALNLQALPPQLATPVMKICLSDGGCHAPCRT